MTIIPNCFHEEISIIELWGGHNGTAPCQVPGHIRLVPNLYAIIDCTAGGVARARGKPSMASTVHLLSP